MLLIHPLISPSIDKDNGQEIVFLHKVIKGIANKSYGIHVAELAGLPYKVILRAKKILSGLENKSFAFRNVSCHIEKQPLPEVTTEHNEQVKHYITEINPDELSPKEALEKIYELKKILKSE